MKYLQRTRYTRHVRDMLNEVSFSRKQLIQPLFIVEGLTQNEPIASLRGNVRLSGESCISAVASDLEAGVENFMIFFVPAKKQKKDFNHDFPTKVLSKLSSTFGNDAFFWIDTCLCSKSDTGHCCIFSEEGEVDYEQTHKELTQFAVQCAQAGANGIAPSDMIDGRVAALRAGLDGANQSMTPIMSYSTKFSSSFYGPFRDAADSAPQFGDRKQYQLDVRNRSAAIAASIRCAEEGADILMVKPGMTSIDLIKPIAEATGKQVGAYQVSGEFGGLSLLGDNNLINFDLALLETWNVFRRAGASFIITYGARFAKSLNF